MRKTVSVAITMSIALILALLSTEMRTAMVTVKASGLAAARHSSVSFNPTLQRVPFIWVTPSEEKGYPTYKRVEGGMHQDGTFQFRGNFTKMGAIIQTADMSL